MAQKITVLIGPPCSGKSTWAKNSLDNNTRIVSRDNIREMLYGSYKMNFEDEDIISEICENILHLLLMEGKSVIVDNTNCNIKYFKPFIEELKKKHPHVHIEYNVFQIDEDTFIERNSKRTSETGKSIPLSVFTKMNKDLEKVIEYLSYTN